MTLEAARANRPLAWMALVAILLLAMMPTISQVRAALAPPAHHDHHASHMAHHGPGMAGEREHHGDDGDCWIKCGYCNFLAQTPSLPGVPYVAFDLLRVDATPTFLTRSLGGFTTPILAAHPRGPPLSA